MKKIREIISLTLAFLLCVSFNVDVFAENISTDTTNEEIYEIAIAPENHAAVLLNTDATYHNSKDKISEATQYAYVNTSTTSKTLRAYTFVTEFYIPIKSALKSMKYNHYTVREIRTAI